MHLTFKIASTADMLPPERELAQAAGRGVSNAVKAHLRTRNFSTSHSDGLPKSNYYGEAANSVTTDMQGKVAVVWIQKEGMALHYYGGVVYPGPGKKALAVPKHPAAAGRRPAELDPDRSKLSLVWPKGKSTGTLRNKESGEVYYLLIPKATIQADQSILPTEAALVDAGNSAMEAIL